MSQPNTSQHTSFHSKRPVVALMTDFGLGDGDVGVMKGVIVSIAPDVQLIDITHDVAPQNVPSGAFLLCAAYRYFPQNTVFVCVVDPGVGSSRNAIAIHAGDWFFVGPDNGLFSYIFAEQAVHGAVILSNPTYQLSQVSSTFHGRDIFAPAGAHLARGIALNELGTAIDPSRLQRLNIGLPTRQRGQTDKTSKKDTIDAHIIHIDNFGNLITNIPLTMVPDLFSSPHVQIIFPKTGAVVDKRRRFFADGPESGEPFIYGDSSGYVGIAVRNGNASKTLGIGYGTSMALVIPGQ